MKNKCTKFRNYRPYTANSLGTWKMFDNPTDNHTDIEVPLYYKLRFTKLKKPTGYWRYYHHSRCRPPHCQWAAMEPGVHTMNDELILSCNIFMAFKWISMMTSGQNISHYALMCEIMTWSDDKTKLIHNKANLRNLIAVTVLVILLKLDSNHRLISLCDLEIWWMTSENNKASFLYYIKICASFQIHW